MCMDISAPARTAPPNLAKQIHPGAGMAVKEHNSEVEMFG